MNKYNVFDNIKMLSEKIILFFMKILLLYLNFLEKILDQNLKVRTQKYTLRNRVGIE